MLGVFLNFAASLDAEAKRFGITSNVAGVAAGQLREGPCQSCTGCLVKSRGSLFELELLNEPSINVREQQDCRCHSGVAGKRSHGDAFDEPSV